MVTSKCLCHVLHRVAVPIITRRGILSSLYRAAACLGEASLFESVCTNINKVLRENVVPVHAVNEHPDDILS